MARTPTTAEAAGATAATQAARTPDADTSMNSAATTAADAATAAGQAGGATIPLNGPTADPTGGEPGWSAPNIPTGDAAATDAPSAPATTTVTTPDGEQVEVRARTRNAPGARIITSDPNAAVDVAALTEQPPLPEDATEAETFVARPSSNSGATERVTDPLDRGDIALATGQPADVTGELTQKPEGEHVPLSSGMGGAYKIEDGKRVPDVQTAAPAAADENDDEDADAGADDDTTGQRPEQKE